ncbi:MAG: hypothetical protein R3A44_30580 [Caldilineaceae bacterium]
MGHTVTLELPDALYHKLMERSQQTHRSLEEELLTAFAIDLPVLPPLPTSEFAAYEEILNFLSSGPTPAQIVEFRLSDTSQERARWLLAKERGQGLSDDETQELDYYVELGDFLGILRAKAQLLKMNRPRIVQRRTHLIQLGRYPR